MSCLLNLQARDTYFMESGDKIRYFFEEGALNEKGELIVDKQRCLNKIGHVRYQYSFEFFQLWKWQQISYSLKALHWLDPDFKRVSFSTQVKNTLRDIGFKDPAIAQSMWLKKKF